MRSFVLPALLSLGMCAAVAVVAYAQSPPNPPDAGIADGSLQRSLDAARRSWKAATVRSYRYEIQRSCFCGRQTSRLVVVHGGVAKRWPRGLRSVATVPRLFRLIQGAIDGGAARITATYGRFGVPREVYVDRALYISDEESGYSIRRFTRLKPRSG